jgi:hypothetical protein
MVEVKAAAERDRSRQSDRNNDALNSLRSLDLLACSFAARALGGKDEWVRRVRADYELHAR